MYQGNKFLALKACVYFFYSGSCGHFVKFQEMEKIILERVPETKVNGWEGRQASFEVEIDKTLVYSKLKTMAFPDFEEIADIVEDVANGHCVRKALKQQPINCSIM
uniref:Uncharacterized protein n=1 Tax=Clastoptera arizonana TaxID=38151 RepID=A0A1B6CDG1_9HEMI